MSEGAEEPKPTAAETNDTASDQIESEQKNVVEEERAKDSLQSSPSIVTSGWLKPVFVHEPPAESEPQTIEPTPEQTVVYKDAVTDAKNEVAAEDVDTLRSRGEDQIDTLKSFRYGYMLKDADFRAILKSVSRAIQAGINPERIKQGSSGSYFVLNDRREIVGVFKPKTEEPYGHLNPKMTKWLHKTCCPCFFGRSCIIPNTGFLSEAAASIVDRQLGLNMVPRTEIVKLASPSFHYGYWARMRAKSRNGRFPEKLGSFQLFVNGFKDASEVIPQYEVSEQILPDVLKDAFQREFERLVILDYAIRNTDRSMDNWMIHISWETEDESETQEDSSPGTFCMIPKSTSNRKPVVKIAAIDHGLAFPFKYPDNWRAYPYSWTTLSLAKRPFSDQTCAEFIPILSDPTSWDTIIDSLELLYKADPAEFDRRIFDKQMAILRGQLHNILEALVKRESPLQLAQKTRLLIEPQEDYYVGRDGRPTQGAHDDMLPYARRMVKREAPTNPWFSFC